MRTSQAAPPPASGWRKSRASFANGNCAEAAAVNGAVVVRDTADRGGPVLAFPATAWAAFTAELTS